MEEPASCTVTKAASTHLPCSQISVALVLLLAAVALVAVFVVKLRSSPSSNSDAGSLNASGSGGTGDTSTTPLTVADPNAPFTGRCGVAFGGAMCPTVANSYTQGYAPCCGADGYCGSSYFSCGAGCQSGCDALAPSGNLNDTGDFVEAGRSGVPSMHLILVPKTSNVIFLAKQELRTELNLTSDPTRYAYAAEWNPTTLSLTGLDLKTNPFCSGIGTTPNGSIFSAGGSLNYNDAAIASGYDGWRILNRPCSAPGAPDCDWQEWPTIPDHKLQSPRWYPTTLILPDSRMFIIGGIGQFDQGLAVDKITNNPTYEYYPQNPSGNFHLDLLEAPNVYPFQMYPHVHVLRSGKLFIMAGLSSLILDTNTNAVVRELPDIPGIYPRTYPSVAAGTLLPLSPRDNYTAHFMVCGGGHPDLWIEEPATNACGIITPEAASPSWDVSESMPQARVMVHPVILPDGSVLFINGAKKGHQGFEAAKDPVFAPDLFIPGAPKAKRWWTLSASTIPRMYHSVSQLMPDGRVLISGSNPHLDPNFTDPYPTEYRNEFFTPPYLKTSKTRPAFTADPPEAVAPGEVFTVTGSWDSTKPLQASFYFPGGVTHS
ncbi:galactose oxidase [Gonapodya prolifera JEL478]|uniref:Galactose oxidase n=1 Tax=Gonapodya prolifera (strain JEL478) TaxID=1344416 RepID=A0A139ATM7_GONPJ|nr:galactose oxidase [Gonapodya prolifera JEL478]|eukprot:KXS19923.1 galactose oxidase [Gonapodya prolifera JEL478]